VHGDLPAALAEFRQEMDIDPDNASAGEQAAEIESALAARQKGNVTGPPTGPGH